MRRILVLSLSVVMLASVATAPLHADSSRLTISQTRMDSRARDQSTADTCDSQHPLNCRRAIAYWHKRSAHLAAAVAWQKHARVKLAAPTVNYAIELACASQPTLDCGWFKRMIGCESHGDPRAANAHSTAKGLAEFLDGTWSGNLYHQFSVFDPIANALGAAWYAVRDGHAPWASSAGCWG